MDKDAVLESIRAYIELIEEKDRWMTVYITVADTSSNKTLIRFFEKGDFIEIKI